MSNLTEVDTEILVSKYVQVRDSRDTLKEQQAEALAPYEHALGMVAAELERRMLDSNLVSMKTTAGTASRTITQTVMCEDWTAFDKWVIDNNRPDVFPRKLNSSPFKDMLEAGQQLPPGIRMEQASRISVRRATKAKA